MKSRHQRRGGCYIAGRAVTVGQDADEGIAIITNER